MSDPSARPPAGSPGPAADPSDVGGIPHPVGTGVAPHLEEGTGGAASGEADLVTDAAPDARADAAVDPALTPAAGAEPAGEKPAEQLARPGRPPGG